MRSPGVGVPASVPLSLRGAWLWLVLAMVLAGGVVAAHRRDPWDPDESRYLQVTREMVDRRNPVLLTFNGQPYSDKPPLYFWLLAPGVALLGADSALAGLVPSALALVGLAFAASRLGRSAGLDAPTARLGAVLTVTSFLPATLAAGCRMDLLFALWSALALERLVTMSDPDLRHPARSHLLLWFWLALGVLTKGPIALALPLLAAAALAPLHPLLLRRAVAGWGPLLAVALVGAWLVPAAVIGGSAWLDETLVFQTLDRVSGPAPHLEPWWYHVVTMPLTMLPWSPLAIAAVATAVRRRRTLSPGLLLLALFPLTTLLGLSLLAGKTMLYPLPLFAPACLVGAWWLCSDPDRTSRHTVLGATGGLMLVLGIALGVAVATRPEISLHPASASLVGLTWAAPAALALAALWARRSLLSAGALTLILPLFLLLGFPPLASAANRWLSLKPYGAALAAVEPHSDLPALVFGRVRPGMLLFSGRHFHRLETLRELRLALASGRPVTIGSQDFKRLARDRGMELKLLAEIPFRHGGLLLVSGP